jgi:dihydrofolate reductase
MRNLIFAINITADGYCDHTLCNPDDEVVDYFTRLMQEAGVLLYGRKTYELMFPYWPEVAKNPSGHSVTDIEFAQAFVGVPEIVVASKTLNLPERAKTKILRGNLKDEIQKLKSEPGKSISTGGVSFPSELLELGLIDEIRLVVHPVIAGSGRRLFDGASLKEKLDLKLVESHVFRSGAVALHYLKQ